MPIENVPTVSRRAGVNPNQARQAGAFRPVRGKERFLVFGAPAIGDAEIVTRGGRERFEERVAGDGAEGRRQFERDFRSVSPGLQHWRGGQFMWHHSGGGLHPEHAGGGVEERGRGDYDAAHVLRDRQCDYPRGGETRSWRTSTRRR